MPVSLSWKRRLGALSPGSAGSPEGRLAADADEAEELLLPLAACGGGAGEG